MKTRVFVLIPCDVLPAEIGEFIRMLLEPHRYDPDEPGPRGRYDYLVGALGKTFDDPIAEGRFPPDVRRSFSGNICERQNLPAELVPGALVTPEGEWHDLGDFGWRMVATSEANQLPLSRWEERYRQLLDLHPSCWVVAIWAHS